MEKVGSALAEVVESGEAGKAVFLNIPGVLLRNIFFMWVVLAHGFRRILPPY